MLDGGGVSRTQYTPTSAPVYGPFVNEQARINAQRAADQRAAANADAARAAREAAQAAARAAAERAAELRRQLEAQRKAIQEAQRKAFLARQEAAEAEAKAKQHKNDVELQKKAQIAREKSNLELNKHADASAQLKLTEKEIELQEEKKKDAENGRASTDPSAATRKAQSEYDVAKAEKDETSAYVKGSKADIALGNAERNKTADVSVLKAESDAAWAEKAVAETVRERVQAKVELDKVKADQAVGDTAKKGGLSADELKKKEAADRKAVSDAEDHLAKVQSREKVKSAASAAISADAKAKRAEYELTTLPSDTTPAEKTRLQNEAKQLRADASAKQAEALNVSAEETANDEQNGFAKASNATSTAKTAYDKAAKEYNDTAADYEAAHLHKDAAKEEDLKTKLEELGSKRDRLEAEFSSAMEAEAQAKKKSEAANAARDRTRALGDMGKAQADWDRLSEGQKKHVALTEKGTVITKESGGAYDDTFFMTPDGKNGEVTPGSKKDQYKITKEGTLGGKLTYTVERGDDGNWYVTDHNGEDDRKTKMHPVTQRLWDAKVEAEEAGARGDTAKEDLAALVDQDKDLDVGSWLDNSDKIAADVADTKKAVDEATSKRNEWIDQWRSDHDATDPTDANYNGWQSDAGLKTLDDNLAVALQHQQLAAANAGALEKVKTYTEAQRKLYETGYGRLCTADGPPDKERDNVEQTRKQAIEAVNAVNKDTLDLEAARRTEKQGAGELEKAKKALETANSTYADAQRAAGIGSGTPDKVKRAEREQELARLNVDRLQADVAWADTLRTTTLAKYNATLAPGYKTANLPPAGDGPLTSAAKKRETATKAYTDYQTDSEIMTDADASKSKYDDKVKETAASLKKAEDALNSATGDARKTAQATYDDAFARHNVALNNQKSNQLVIDWGNANQARLRAEAADQANGRDLAHPSQATIDARKREGELRDRIGVNALRGHEIKAATEEAETKQRQLVLDNLESNQRNDPEALFNLFKENPDVMAQATINRAIMEFGDAPARMVNDTQLKNLIGVALGWQPNKELDRSQKNGSYAQDNLSAQMMREDIFADAPTSQIEAREEIFKEIKAHGGDTPEVSVVPIVWGSKESGMVSSALFRVKSSNGDIYYVDDQGTFGKGKSNKDAVADWRANNQLSPDAVLVMPEDGEVTVRDDGNVALFHGEARTETWLEEHRGTLNMVAGVVGVVAGTVLVVGSLGTMIAPGAAIVALATSSVVSGVATAGVMATAAYGAVDGGKELWDMGHHGYSLNPIENERARMAYYSLGGAALGGGAAALGARAALLAGRAKAATDAALAAGRTTSEAEQAAAALNRSASAWNKASNASANGALAVGTVGAADTTRYLVTNWDKMSGSDRAVTTGNVLISLVDAGARTWKAGIANSSKNMVNPATRGNTAETPAAKPATPGPEANPVRPSTQTAASPIPLPPTQRTPTTAYQRIAGTTGAGQRYVVATDGPETIMTPGSKKSLQVTRKNSHSSYDLAQAEAARLVSAGQTAWIYRVGFENAPALRSKQAAPETIEGAVRIGRDGKAKNVVENDGFVGRTAKVQVRDPDGLSPRKNLADATKYLQRVHERADFIEKRGDKHVQLPEEVVRAPWQDVDDAIRSINEAKRSKSVEPDTIAAFETYLMTAVNRLNSLSKVHGESNVGAWAAAVPHRSAVRRVADVAGNAVKTPIEAVGRGAKHLVYRPVIEPLAKGAVPFVWKKTVRPLIEPRTRNLIGMPNRPQTIGGATDPIPGGAKLERLYSWKTVAQNWERTSAALEGRNNAPAIEPTAREVGIRERIKAEPRFRRSRAEFVLDGSGAGPAAMMYGADDVKMRGQRFDSYAEAKAALGDGNGVIYRIRRGKAQSDETTPGTYQLAAKDIQGAIPVKGGVEAKVGLPNVGSDAWLNPFGRFMKVTFSGQIRPTAVITAATIVTAVGQMSGPIGAIGHGLAFTFAGYNALSAIGYWRSAWSRGVWFTAGQGLKLSIDQALLGTAESTQRALRRVSGIVNNPTPRGAVPMDIDGAGALLGKYNNTAKAAEDLRAKVDEFTGGNRSATEKIMAEKFALRRIRPQDESTVPQAWVRDNIDRAELNRLLRSVRKEQPDLLGPPRPPRYREAIDTVKNLRNQNRTLSETDKTPRLTKERVLRELLERLDHTSLRDLEEAPNLPVAGLKPEMQLLRAVPGLREKLIATFGERKELNSVHGKLFDQLKVLLPGKKNDDGVVVDIDVGKAEGLAGSNNDPKTIVGNMVRKFTLYSAAMLGGSVFTMHPRLGAEGWAAVELVNFGSLAIADRYSRAVDGLSRVKGQLKQLTDKFNVLQSQSNAGSLTQEQLKELNELPSLIAKKEEEIAAFQAKKDRWNKNSDVYAGSGSAARSLAQGFVLLGAASGLDGAAATLMTAAAAGSFTQGVLTGSWIGMQRNGPVIMPQKVKTAIRVSAFSSMAIVPSASFVIKNFLAEDERKKTDKPYGLTLWDKTGYAIWEKWGDSLPSYPDRPTALPETGSVPLVPETAEERQVATVFPFDRGGTWNGDVYLVADGRYPEARTLDGMADHGLALQRLLDVDKTANSPDEQQPDESMRSAALRALYQLNPQLDPALEDGRVTSDPRDPDRLINGMTMVNLGPQLNSAA